MKELLAKEKYILIREKLIWLCFAVVFLLAFLGAESYTLDLSSTHKDAVGIFAAMLYDSIIWIILFSVVFSFLIGQIFRNRTINNCIEVGHTRPLIYLSTFLIYNFLYNFLLFLYPCIGALRMVLSLGIRGGDLFYILKILSFMLLCNSEVFAILFFIAFLCKDVVATVSINGISILASALIVAYGKPLGWFNRFQVLNLIPMQQIRDIIFC